jgi:hypothetical protein
MSSGLIITRRDRLDLQNRSWIYVIKQKDILFPPDLVYILAYFLAFKGSGENIFYQQTKSHSSVQPRVEASLEKM